MKSYEENIKKNTPFAFKYTISCWRRNLSHASKYLENSLRCKWKHIKVCWKASEATRRGTYQTTFCLVPPRTHKTCIIVRCTTCSDVKNGITIKGRRAMDSCNDGIHVKFFIGQWFQVVTMITWLNPNGNSSEIRTFPRWITAWLELTIQGKLNECRYQRLAITPGFKLTCENGMEIAQR